MRAGVALAFAFVALLAVTASAAAGPSTAIGAVQAPMTPVTLSLEDPAPGPLVDPRPPEVIEPSVFLDDGAAPIPTLGARAQRNAQARVQVKATPPPARADIAGGGGGRSLRGAASWYCRAGVSVCHSQHPDTGGVDAYAAAGPRLREAIGPGWRGNIVSVDGIRVKLVDWCQCHKGERHEKLIDLYYDVYKRTGGNVTIRW